MQGKFVGIVNGQVVTAAQTLSEALRVLREVEPDPARRYCIEASRDYSIVEYIWESRLMPRVTWGAAPGSSKD